MDPLELANDMDPTSVNFFQDQATLSLDLLNPKTHHNMII
jgi:hypothetical protein